jgi:hypothetical protein
VNHINRNGVDYAPRQLHSPQAMPPKQNRRQRATPTPLTKTLLKSRKLRENVPRRKIQVKK